MKYKTAASFVADVQLLSSNAVSFNGPHSVLSKLSVQLLESVKAAVYHDKTTLGEGKDIIQVCEEVIHTKYVLVRGLLALSLAIATNKTEGYHSDRLTLLFHVICSLCCVYASVLV